MILWIANDRDPPAAGFDYVALGHALGGIVRALGMKIGANFADDRAHILLWKDDDRINVGERRENFRTLLGRHHRPSSAFQRANRIIAIDCNNKFAAEIARRPKVANVAHMQQIETAIGQRDAITGTAPRPPRVAEGSARETIFECIDVLND